jgi:transcriptional regulator NrdR family protein
MVNIWQLIAGVVGSISILGTVVTVTAVIIQMKATIANLQVAEAKREVKDEAVGQLLSTLREFMAAQTEFNRHISRLFEQQGKTSERVSDILTDLAARVKTMEHSTVEASQIVSLLTEALKNAKCIARE